MKSFVYMGTPAFAATILHALLDAGRRPLAVACQPARATGRGMKLQPSEVEALAQSRNIPVLSTENINTPKNQAFLRGLNPDLFLVAAFGQILKESTLEIPKLFSLNVHGSLLPLYRGAAPIQRAILDGQTTTGITIQKMALKMDAGDILLKRTTPISATDTAGDLFARLADLGARALLEGLEQIDAGNYAFTPQDESQATYAAKLTKEEAVIDWNQSSSEINRRVRAFQPWPVAESKLGGERIKIFGSTPSEDKISGPPGSLSTDHKTHLVVACGNATALALTQIQLENRKKLETRDFLAAYRGQFPFSKMG